MKKAPNLKHQPRDKMTEVIIFAGSDAWAHATQWQEQDGRLAGDNVPPVWLGEQQLAETGQPANRTGRTLSRASLPGGVIASGAC